MGNLTLFPIEEYTDERLLARMGGNTCRTCTHLRTYHQSYEGQVKVKICEVWESKSTRSGHLRVKTNQPACISYVRK